MYIAQDVVDLIVDQLFLLTYDLEGKRYLRAASLVSTIWVNRSQHHLFSTVELRDSRDIQKWCSRIKSDPCGVSRHVRVLLLGGGRLYISPPPAALEIETALPHLTSFKNLEELSIRHIDLNHTPLGILVPIFSSFTGALKRFRWSQKAPVHETWKTISALTDLLPTHVCVYLSSYRADYDHVLSEIKIRLSVDEGCSRRAIKRFRFDELQALYGVTHSLPLLESHGPHLRVLNLNELQMWEPSKS